MNQLTPILGVGESDLHDAFERELELLGLVEQARGAVVAAIRLRALADISRGLDTNTLVALSAAVATWREDEPDLGLSTGPQLQ